jgi:hypothetical protein
MARSDSTKRRMVKADGDGTAERRRENFLGTKRDCKSFPLEWLQPEKKRVQLAMTRKMQQISLQIHSQTFINLPERVIKAETVSAVDEIRSVQRRQWESAIITTDGRRCRTFLGGGEREKNRNLVSRRARFPFADGQIFLQNHVHVSTQKFTSTRDLN